MSGSERIACFECDLLITLGDLAEGERASCPRCGHHVTARARDGMTRSLALALAAILLLIMSNAFPFLALEASGLEAVMTLPRSALELHQAGYTTVAFLVMGPIIAVPALMLATIVALVVPLRAGRPSPWLIPAGRFLFWLGPWSMVEVFVIGVLVSLVKIGAMATVVLGISFWSYVAFAVTFTATLASLDRVQMWREIEACTP